jgi:hypothetical protein
MRRGRERAVGFERLFLLRRGRCHREQRNRGVERGSNRVGRASCYACQPEGESHREAEADADAERRSAFAERLARPERRRALRQRVAVRLRIVFARGE